MKEGVSLNAENVTQWSIFELSFNAIGTHNWTDFPLQVTFENGETRIKLDGYWDGDNVWKVRFAPALTGVWRWKSFSRDSGMNRLSGAFNCVAPTSSQIANNPNYRGHIKVGPTGRYFTYADGTPFFYLGDTCWSMNEERCGLGNNQDGTFYIWMKDRKRKGFTVINHWFFRSGQHAGDEKTPPSSNEGGYAFSIQDGEYVFDELNPGYYQYVDIRWQALWENGFVMAGPPTWFAKPKHRMTIEQTQNLSHYIMARYGAYNLVWALSGEYSFGKVRENTPWDEVSTWNRLGDFIAAHNPFHHPISIHPGPAVHRASSSIDFHAEDWLDHNWLQTGQYPQGLYRVAVWAQSDYDQKTTKPTLHSEGFYEGKASRYQVRFQPWVAFLNGACGAVYGAHSIWTFHDANNARTMRSPDGLEWRAGLNLPGSTDMKHLRDFFASLKWWKLVPHRDWLRVDGEPPLMPSESDITPPHCSAKMGKVYVIYIPQGNGDKTISVTHLARQAYHAQWYNPRDGSYSDINSGNPINMEHNDEWPLPPSPSKEDWVCCLKVAEKVIQIASVRDQRLSEVVAVAEVAS